MSTFYTNAYQWGNEILYRGVENGVRVKKRIKYQPTLYIPCNDPTGMKSVDGKNVKPVQFNSISSAKDFAKGRKDVYGYDRYAYTYLCEEFMGEIDYDPSLIRVAWLDIETDMQGGASPVDVADRAITLITVKIHDEITTFGCQEYEPSQDNVRYVHCRDEYQLLRRFLKLWNSDAYTPDVVSGWNISGYDLPYMVTRIEKVLGEGASKKLSPWNILQTKRIVNMGKEREVEYPVGIAVLDYLDLYQKLAVATRAVETPDNYKLNTVAHNELGIGKLDYSQYESLLNLQLENWKTYVDYNIVDVELVEKIDQGRALMDLAFDMAFNARANFEDVLGSVKKWEAMAHHRFMRKGVILPPRKKAVADELVGAYVKEPQLGKHKWVVSVDATSLYPSLIMMFNISPDTKRAKAPFDITVEDIVNGADSFTSWLQENDVMMAANMQTYSRNKGLLPEILEALFDERAVAKKKMLGYKQEYADTKDKRVKTLIGRWNNKQMTAKVNMNALYGVLTNLYFILFDFDNAEAITKSGQMVTKYFEKIVNEYLNDLFKTESVDYVIYCDTDSAYLNMDPVVEKFFPGLNHNETTDILSKIVKEKIEPYTENKFAELAARLNTVEQKIIFKREAIAASGLWTGAKYYILSVIDNEGVRYKEPEIKITGMAAVKSSTPSACREALVETIRLIMLGTEEEVQEYITNFKAKFITLPFDEIAFPRSVKGMEKWKDPVMFCRSGTPIQVRASMIYNDMLDRHGLDAYPRIYDGEKIKYVYLQMPNIIQANVIGTPGPLPTSFKIEESIDWEVMFEKAFMAPLESILEAIGWSSDQGNTLF